MKSENYMNISFHSNLEIDGFSCKFSWILNQYYFMTTSWHKNVFGITGPRWGGHTIEFPSWGPARRTFDFSFLLSANTLLNKQSSCWWYKTSQRSCDVSMIYFSDTRTWNACRALSARIIPLCFSRMASVWFGIRNWGNSAWSSWLDNFLYWTPSFRLLSSTVFISLRFMYMLSWPICLLTHWDWDNLAAILQTTFSKWYFCMKTVVVELKLSQWSNKQ